MRRPVNRKAVAMKKAIGIAAGVIAVSAAACLIVHRRVVVALVKGEPLPEPPAWHKHCGLHKA